MIKDFDAISVSRKLNFVHKLINDFVTTQELAAQREKKAAVLAAKREEPLTKFLNRAAFDEDVGAISSTERVCIMNIDLTALGFCNDALGHEGANEAIKFFADKIKITVDEWHEGGSLPNKLNIVYRQGGDEFAVICYPKADRAHLDCLVEALVAITYVGRGTEAKYKGVECHSWLRIGAVWKVGATVAEADALEAKVKQDLKAAGARLEKGKPAPSLAEVRQLQSGSAWNYLCEIVVQIAAGAEEVAASAAAAVINEPDVSADEDEAVGDEVMEI